MAKYYKSRYLPDPFVYVAEADTWLTYAPGGAMRESRGPIPEGILQKTEEIDSREARQLIDAKLEAAQVEQAASEAWVKPGPSGLGGWLILPILGLLLTAIAAAARMFGDILPMFRSVAWARLTTPGAGAYHPMWKPLYEFAAFYTVVLFVGSLVLLILMFRKQRILPGLIICFYCFCFLAVLVDSSVVLGFGAEMIPNTALREQLGWSAGSVVPDLARALLPTAIWIPYFLLSKRVKNTFVNPPIAPEMVQRLA